MKKHKQQPKRQWYKSLIIVLFVIYCIDLRAVPRPMNFIIPALYGFITAWIILFLDVKRNNRRVEI